jgi:hypothetical protein
VVFSFRLEIDAQNEWLLVKSPPTSKRKRSVEEEIPPPPPPPPPATSNDLDDVLRTIAQPATTTKSPEKDSFSFQFGNKRGRPIPPRPQVISAVKVILTLSFIPSNILFCFQINSLVPRQVMTNKR